MKRPEEMLQRSIVQYLGVMHPHAVWFATSNQRGTRSKFEMGVLKAMGVRAGVSDLAFCLPGGRFAAMELKSDKGRPTEAQMAFLARVEAAGGRQAIVRTLDEAIACFDAWGLPLGK